MATIEMGPGVTHNTDKHRELEAQKRAAAKQRKKQHRGKGRTQMHAETYFHGAQQDRMNSTLEYAEELLEHSTYGIPLGIGRKILVAYRSQQGYDRIQNAIDRVQREVASAGHKPALINIASFNARKALQFGERITNKKLTLDEAKQQLDAMQKRK